MSDVERTPSPDRLAYWYFRLNGFLTTENFVVHPDSGSSQRTDADLLAVRFRHRQELLSHSMNDDPAVADCSQLANIVIAEVKTGECSLNGPWTRPESQNMLRVIRSVGCVSADDETNVTRDLYDRGKWVGEHVAIRIAAIGEFEATRPIPALQLTWDQIIEFCLDRFTAYRNAKNDIDQWAEDGKRLRAAALSLDGRADIRALFGLRQAVDT